MYMDGQVIYSYTLRKPVVVDDTWDPQYYKGRTYTHFIEDSGNRAKDGTIYKIAFPISIEEAQLLLEQNRIVPAPVPPSHCWKCGNWHSNHNPDGSCWTRTANV